MSEALKITNKNGKKITVYPFDNAADIEIILEDCDCCSTDNGIYLSLDQARQLSEFLISELKRIPY